MLQRLARPSLQRVARLATSVAPRSSAASTSFTAIRSIAHSAAPTAATPSTPHTAASASHDSHSASHDAHHGEKDMRHELPWKFGEDPTKTREREDWELPFYLGMGSFFFLGWFAHTYGPNTNMHYWAREEAFHTGFKAPEPAPDLED